MGAETREMYLELLKRSVTHSLYSSADAVGYPPRGRIRRRVLAFLRRRGIVPVRLLPDPEVARTEGRAWPLFAQTMIGIDRLDNLRACIEAVLADDVPGDLIEAGVWRGGTVIWMRGILKAHGVRDRMVWGADSFRGLPVPNAEAYPADADGEFYTIDHLVVSADEVRGHLRRYGLLDQQVRLVEGWFRDTLPALAEHRWALIHLDGDMYESTIDALANLYPRLSPGGFLIVDDYSIEACRKAVEDYRAEHGIIEPIERVDWTAVYWRRAGGVGAR